MPVLTLPQSDTFSLTIRAKALVFEDKLSVGLLAHIRQIAPSDATVLVTGETGTGKEIVARHLHELSGRRARPFVAVNCGAFSESLVESELFGHEKGSFTGAHAAKHGWFEAAQGGTLFLDEIGDLPLGVQVKLLRVLQEREVVRVGSRQPIPIDVRLIAATNIDLQDAVQAEKFREDLYYRLNVATLTIPPLRDRVDDIPPLARHFINVYGQRLNTGSVALTDSATDLLLSHPWPGNIRELENVIHRALLVCREGRITVDDLRLPAARVKTAAPMKSETEDGLTAALLKLFEQGIPNLHARVEETLVRASYNYCHRNQLQTARLLGVSRNVVRARLIQMGELSGPLRAPTTIRIGYQQFGLLELVRSIGALERVFSKRAIRVSWTGFPSGSELVHAIEAGKLDLGVVGEGPPLLARSTAEDGPLVYLAAEPPAPEGEAIVVRTDATIGTVGDLRGRRILVHRGANVHYFLARALEEAGLKMGDVSIAFLPPVEAAAAFERGEADAWVIWDPLLASVQHAGGVRILRDASGLCTNRAYYVGARAFADAHADLVDLFLKEVRSFGDAANKNTDAIAELLAPSVGYSQAVLARSLRRNRFGLQTFDAEIEAHQQSVADSSHKLNLIPQPMSVAGARWRRPTGGQGNANGFSALAPSITP